MNCCGHCLDAGKIFDDKTAKKELKRYLKRGPNKSTRLLLDEIRKYNLRGGTLLDIGGGIGAITFELLDDGIDRSVSVDASPAYLKVLKAEAENRGLAHRIEQIYGDITGFSNEINSADIVTLDRVFCCYPDLEKLIDRTVTKANRFYGLVYPRNRLSVRWVMKSGNIWLRLRKSNFRTYIHSTAEIDTRIRGYGFQRIALLKTIVWEVALYERIIRS